MSRKLINDRVYRIMLAGCAVFMILLGVYFGWSGIAKLAR